MRLNREQNNKQTPFLGLLGCFMLTSFLPLIVFWDLGEHSSSQSQPRQPRQQRENAERFSIAYNLFNSTSNNSNVSSTSLSSLETFSRFNFSSPLRRERFPSVKERVQIYMSSWYSPPCTEGGRFFYYLWKNQTRIATTERETKSNATVESVAIFSWWKLLFDEFNPNLVTTVFENAIAHDTPFFFDPVMLQESNVKSQATSILRVIYKDLLHNMLPSIQKERNGKGIHEAPPLLMQFGDSEESVGLGQLDIPIVKKFRPRLEKSELRSITSRSCVHALENPDEFPIIWLFGTDIHYGYRLGQVQKYDIPYEEKFDKAIFLGSPTGPLNEAMLKPTDREKCLTLPRCALVYNHFNSSLINASLTTGGNFLPDTLDDRKLVQNSRIPVSEFLRYKAIIMLEGNDVSSGLKWALLSKSVVMMPHPTKTSFAMEEFLEPFVHYVPLKDDLSDAEPQMQWIIDNPIKAKEISEAGTRWIMDLYVASSVDFVIGILKCVFVPRHSIPG
ncbi:hypothetical protein ACA910_007189 [Epithemia clementina (nom. ined.)]